MGFSAVIDVAFIFFNTNTLVGSSPEYMVKVDTPGGGFPYNNVKFFTLIRGLSRYNV